LELKCTIDWTAITDTYSMFYPTLWNIHSS
jgi:hypothetical protein